MALLFFWEEELVRWRALEEEDAEAVGALQRLEGRSRGDGEDVAEEERLQDTQYGDRTEQKLRGFGRLDAEGEEMLERLKVGRGTIEARRMMMPSLRSGLGGDPAEDAVAVQAEGPGLALPEYGQRGTVGIGVVGRLEEELY